MKTKPAAVEEISWQWRILLGVALCAFAVSACSGEFQPKPLLQKVLVLPYDDFGPEQMVAPWLGPRQTGAQVVVHYQQPVKALSAAHQAPAGEPPYRFIPVRQAIYHLERQLHGLPRTSQHTEERSRMQATLVRLKSFYQAYRAAFTAVPPYHGRGVARRSMMAPAL